MDTKEMAQDIVKSHVVYSLGAGLVPIPLLDIAAVSVVQLDMLRQLAKLYGKDFKESSGKSLISAISGSTMARMGASMVKSIPGIGSILGGVTMSVLSGASTYAVGQVFIWHFGGGGDLTNFNFDKAREIYEREFEKGKKVAKDIEKKDDVNGGEQDEDVYAKLEKLAKLKAKGVITEEDFETQKKRLLENI
ncbi:MAG: DUF697 domain-containing protein [Saprospiraceae bacterium]|nr:DUF697 domain-containing protein [Saprospiraceae bacterium]